ncbi:Retrovirus-related Pol polyprotein from transposon RE1 [Linum grandiflorum]
MAIPHWRNAVIEEIKALEKNQTWEIVKHPTGKTLVDCKWIFTVKYTAAGAIKRYKARLVARGFTQSYGVDYEEIFAPVAKLKTVRILLSLAVNLDWPLYQLDIKNAFLNGDLSEEVYMKVPIGVQQPGPGMVCKLRKALYGVKQSPRAWFERFSQALKSFDYHQCQADHTMFVKHGHGGKISILIVYVDDIIITGSDEHEIQSLKRRLAAEFERKDLGNLRYFLDIEVAITHQGLMLSQRKYVLDLLQETGMTGCKPASTPMEPNLKFSHNFEVAPVERGSYQRLVGKLIYLAHTRPDISYPVGIVSQHMHHPNEEHLEAVMRILRYLKSTPGMGLHFQKHQNKGISVYSDASWTTELTDRRFTSAYCSYVWGNLVTRRSKKQAVVARSSAEAEYRAIAEGNCEGVWLKRVLRELKMEETGSVTLLCDSRAALSIVKNPVHHDRTKHVELDRHFITEKVTSNEFEMVYVPSKLQIADILTKPLPRDTFDNL